MNPSSSSCLVFMKNKNSSSSQYTIAHLVNTLYSSSSCLIFSLLVTLGRHLARTGYLTRTEYLARKEYLTWRYLAAGAAHLTSKEYLTRVEYLTRIEYVTWRYLWQALLNEYFDFIRLLGNTCRYLVARYFTPIKEFLLV